MADFTPSDQQGRAIAAINTWFKTPTAPQVFYLAGYAGTGKTSLVRRAVEDIGLDPDSYSVRFGAYTGKAALILRRKGLGDASTIHKMLYIPHVDPQTGRVRFVLDRKESVLNDARLVVLDECSMIDEKLWNDLLSFENIRILVIGDPGQLPPVNGKSVFDDRKPDVFLDEIHRQARDNPIIWAATQARLGKPIPHGDYDGKVCKIPHIPEFTLDDMLLHDQIITGKNVTRRVLNASIKDHLGFDHKYPLKGGAKVICLRNQHDIGLLNGMTFNTLGTASKLNQKHHYFTQSVYDDEQVYEDLPIYTGYFDEYDETISEGEHWKRQTKLREKLEARNLKPSFFDYGFVITAYKSQGSTYDSVCFYDDGFGSWDADIRRRHLYTSYTRPAEHLTIISEY